MEGGRGGAMWVACKSTAHAISWRKKEEEREKEEVISSLQYSYLTGGGDKGRERENGERGELGIQRLGRERVYVCSYWYVGLYSALCPPPHISNLHTIPLGFKPHKKNSF